MQANTLKVTSSLSRVSRFICLLIFTTINANAAAVEIAPLVDGLGEHSYPLPHCSAKLQAFFDQGLKLYYGFRFPESLASFRQASKLDPKCAMAAWGEALAIGPNPNSRYLAFPDDPKGEGLLAIRRALTLSNNSASKYHGLIEALHLRYEGNVVRNQRDDLYSKAMAGLAATYSNDTEILTLYTEALMTQSAWDYWTPDGKPRPGTNSALEALNNRCRPSRRQSSFYPFA
jgi:hypothetical protein